MRHSLRTIIALAMALGVIVGAAVAAAATGDPTPPVMPMPVQGGGTSPGSVGTGQTGLKPDPVSPQEPCGQQLPIDPAADPDTAVSYVPCPGDEPVDGFGHAQTVVPAPGMANVRPVPWTKATAADDDTTVTVRFWSGVEPCYVLDHVDVSYATDAVTITLFQGNDPSAGDVACIEIAQLKQTVVSLSEPLAGRQILDGAAT
jgi:hypothetical protein